MEIKLRSELSDDFKWNLTHLYKNLEEFNNDLEVIENNIEKLKEFNGKLSDTKQLKKCLDLSTSNSKLRYKLFTYANRYFDQEQNNEDADKLVQKLKDVSRKYSSNAKFITDEIIHFGDITIANIFLDNELIDYHFDIQHILKRKSHILSKVEEELLTKISDVFSTSDEVYTVFKNTELKYPEITLSDGKNVTLNDQNYRELRESNVREDRKLAFDKFWETYDSYKGTFSKLMYKFIKSNVTDDKIRNYKSSLESALSSDNISTEVYNKLIENVNSNLDKFHNYLTFRKETLNYTDLNYFDLYNPIIKNTEYKYNYEDAKDLLIKSTAVLGDDYTNIMKKALSENWIDVYPNKFKDTGAYMSGSAYDVHPYILLNYNDRFNDVSTLCHELGHAGHSVLSNTNQIFNKASYSTFIAEIASTTNEILLFNYMYNNTDDKQLKIFLLNNYIEHFRTTVFRQTMFSEFEQFMYETVENEQVLTPSTLNDKYFELLERYHGSDKDIMKVDKLYANEWTFIPHFYYNFYVFQYSTSFISAVIIATKILNGDKDQLEKYMELLKSGGKDYPVELLQKAGVDLTDENCYKIAFDDFQKHIDELKELLK